VWDATEPEQLAFAPAAGKRRPRRERRLELDELERRHTGETLGAGRVCVSGAVDDPVLGELGERPRTPRVLS